MRALHPWSSTALSVACTAACAHATTGTTTTTAQGGPGVVLPVAAAGASATYTRFAVAADHPEASAAGAEVLARGGSAADAAAATMLALGVASPASSGLGGGGFALYYSAREHRVTFLDFRERAPAGATVDMLAHGAEGTQGTQGAPGTPPSGVPTAAQTPGESLHHDAGVPALPERVRPAGVSVGIPGEPRGIDELLHRFGVLPRGVVVEPAARLAEHGFTPSAYMAGLSQRFVGVLRRDPLGTTWVPQGGTGMVAGQRVVNPALAHTLRAFGAHGAAIFYEGEIARDIVAADQRIGGRLTLDDLRGYEVTERPALEASRFGHRWVTVPPESAGGYTLLASLALLEHWLPTDGTRRTEADVLHAMVESWRGPAVDRARYFTDPDYTPVAVEALLAPDRIAARAARFSPEHTRPSLDYDLPLAGTAVGIPAHPPVGTGTSHICVVDADGNIASVTTTVNIPFGAGTSVDGFWLNDQMDDFSVTAVPPGAPGATVLPGGYVNLPAPGHRPVSSMTPTIVFQGDNPVLCVGGSGGGYIITAVIQAAYRTVVLGESPAEAVAHPRIHQAAMPDVVGAEAGTSPEVLAGLRARGHAVDEMHYGAMVQMVQITRGPQGTVLVATSDPRKGGRPAGR